MRNPIPVLITDAEVGKLGPGMRALVPRQRNFVWALFEQGNRDCTAAARKAGYADTPNLKMTAHALWHDERIQAAIHEEGQRRLNGMVPMALERLASILENPQTDAAAGLKGVNMILDRAGLHAVSERKTTVEHSISDPGTIDRIRLLAASLGVDPERLLGARLARQTQPKVIEGEFEEVPSMEDFL